ncbi:MAG: hypothetical protein HOC74_12030 [Gemmatimonadetes bacterium]|nr:hypothetical protein [Gemmatimonadota bacterium]
MAEHLEEKFQPILNLSEAEILRQIPTRSGLYFIACPNCDNGTQENQISWTIDRPDELFCKFCGIRYPNDKFPDDQILQVENPVGEIQEYPYWEDESGYRHFFRAKGWYLQREYFASAAKELARLYAVTREREYAHRSALILHRFAQVYPGYCVHFDFPFKQKILYPGKESFPYPVPDFRAAKWSWWAYMDIPENLLQAYEIVQDSGELDEGMRNCIENDLFKASVSFARSHPPGLSNMDPTLLRALIVAGRVLKEPEYIHYAVDWIGRLVQRQFFADGAWREGAVSYHNQTVGGLNQLIELLASYRDPEGYVHPETGEHLDCPDLTQRLPILEKAQQIPDLLRYPNGRVVALHDTWAREQRAPTESSSSMLLPAMGHARLGRGTGEDQIQTHLHFSGGYGHQHADLLAITLFSRGCERLADIGYTHTRHRHWAITTLSHNTVTVDGQDQHPGNENDPSDGNLLLYVPGDELFQAIESSGERAYLGLVDAYRRQLLLIGISPQEAYAVDLFHVAGGHRHEYVLAGDANHDGRLTHDLPTTTYGETLLPEGVSARLPTGESVPGDAEGHNLGYAFIRQVRQTSLSGPWTATFHSEGERPGGVRVHGFGTPGDQLFTGDAPSIRRAGEDDGELDRFTMPILVHRREGETPLSSLFATVLEPHGERPLIDRVEHLPVDAEGAIALRISWEEGTDYLLCSADGETVLQVEDMELRGRIGFVRQRQDNIERMILIGGTLLRKGEMELRGEGLLSGNILAVRRRASGDAADGFLVDSKLPTGDQLKGLFAIVHFGDGFTRGCEIVGVAEEEGEALLLLKDDPGFAIESDATSHHCFFPGRSWDGQNTFEIATVSTWQG